MADKALLVGINVYLNVNPLRGCENNVAQMRTLLMETFGFPEADIRVRSQRECHESQRQPGAGLALGDPSAGRSCRLPFFGSWFIYRRYDGRVRGRQRRADLLV